MIPVVFLHGFLGSPSDWDSVIFHLPSFSCLALSLPGHNHAPLTFSCSIPRFHLVGYSMGGRLACMYAKQHPEQIASLTVLSTHPGLLSEKEKALRWEHDLTISKKLQSMPIDDFLHAWYDQPIFCGYKPSFATRKKHDPKQLAEALLHYSLAKQERFAIDYAMVGEKDHKFRSLHPDPIVIANAGHMIHLENPIEVARHLYDRLDSFRNIPRH